MKWPWTKSSVEPLIVGAVEDLDRAKIDVKSTTWASVKNWAERELQEMLEENASALHDERKTALIRGEIKRLKALLDLPKRQEAED